MKVNRNIEVYVNEDKFRDYITPDIDGYSYYTNNEIRDIIQQALDNTLNDIIENEDRDFWDLFIEHLGIEDLDIYEDLDFLQTKAYITNKSGNKMVKPEIEEEKIFNYKNVKGSIQKFEKYLKSKIKEKENIIKEQLKEDKHIAIFDIEKDCYKECLEELRKHMR